jgi:outer membrane biosynthesis protein TonB
VDCSTVELEHIDGITYEFTPHDHPMWKATEALTLIQAAEKAAGAGNYLAAENLLREAARLQEANLGPRHEDLANTLNNLGIVCEMTGKPEDAEQYFRRAVSIARTSLHPDHPFVATSQKNLRDFCEARGKKVDLPPPVEAPATPPPAPPKPAQDVTRKVEAAPTGVKPPTEVSAPAPAPRTPTEEELEDPEVTSRKFFHRLALGALGPIAMLMVVLAVGLPRLGAPELNPPSASIAAAPTRDIAPPPEPAPVEPIAGPEETTPEEAAPEETPTPAAASDEEPVERTSAPEPTRPVIVRASLCGDLDDWACDPADRPVPTGPLFFYTQIKSATATTVQHRWYQDGRLLQTVSLRVQPNRTAGYRTYSRNVMKDESAGNWRIEVRSQDGAVLHEERFTVH